MKKPTLTELLATSIVMASMRDTAFGMKTRVQTFDILDRAEKLRNDDALIDQAEAKRRRKMERNKKQAK